MKLHRGSGLAPSHLDFVPEEQGWHRLERPQGARSQLLAAVIALATMVIFVLSFKTFTAIPKFRPPSPGLFFVGFVVLVAVHEVLHALIHPGFGFSGSTYLGFNARRLAFWAHYAGCRSRTRFLVGALFPFMVLSVVPLLACIITPIKSPAIAFFSIFNAILSCSDLISVWFLFRLCPAGALVLTDQNKAWWKEALP